jgi:hypothetical protein
MDTKGKRMNTKKSVGILMVAAVFVCLTAGTTLAGNGRGPGRLVTASYDPRAHIIGRCGSFYRATFDNRRSTIAVRFRFIYTAPLIGKRVIDPVVRAGQLVRTRFRHVRRGTRMVVKARDRTQPPGGHLLVAKIALVPPC